jgi:hypothetical protein
MMSMNNNNMDNIQNYGTPKNNVNYSYDSEMGQLPPVDEVPHVEGGPEMGEMPPVDQGESADLMGPIQPVEIPPGENQNNENVTGGRRKTRRMVSFADMFSNTFTRKRRYRKKSRRVNRNKSRKSSNRRRKTRRY